VKEPVRVCITGAAGQIAYSLTPLVCRGEMFGADQPVILTLLDIPGMEETLHGVVMEVEDCAYRNVVEVIPTTSYETAFRDCDYALLVGAMPRREGMERKDLLEKNAGIFKGQGDALEKYAKKTCKVLCVGNPANTNCLVCMRHAPSIPRENFSALTRLDHNRAKGQIAKRLRLADPQAVSGVIIWGNHSSTQFPDISHATATVGGERRSIIEAVNDEPWLQGDFIKTVQQRGAAVIAARKLSSAASAAHAICDHMRDWVAGSHGEIVSMAVISNGEYGIEKDIIFSFPVRTEAGNWKIVEGLALSEFAHSKLKATEEELKQERAMALSI
jgi:malate dehydrogenase